MSLSVRYLNMRPTGKGCITGMKDIAIAGAGDPSIFENSGEPR